MTSKRSPRNDGSTQIHEHEQRDSLTILIPELLILRLIARSVLLTAALISLPWLRNIYAPTAVPVINEPDPRWVDAPFVVPMLIADLKREGLLNSEMNNVFLGDPGSRAEFLRRNRMDVIGMVYEKMVVEDNSVDFVLSPDGLGESSLEFVDRVLKVGGIAVVRLVEDPSRLFRLPVNYRMAYIRRFGSTVVAIKKISHGDVGEFKGGVRGRKLLSSVNEPEQMKLKKMTIYLRRFGLAIVPVVKISHGSVDGFKKRVSGRKLLSVVKLMDAAPLNEMKEKQMLEKMMMCIQRCGSNIVAAMKILLGNGDELRGQELSSVAELKDKASMDELEKERLKMMTTTYMRRFGSIIMAIKDILHGNIGEFKEGLREKKRLSAAKLMAETPNNEIKERQPKDATMYVRRVGSTVVAMKKISYGNIDEFKCELRGRMHLLIVKLEGETPMSETEEKQLESITMYLPRLMENDDSSNGYLSEADYARKNWEFEGVDLKEKEFVVMEDLGKEEMVSILMDEIG